MKQLLKKIIPERMMRVIRKVRFALRAIVRYPKYLKVENTEISFKARNWPTYMIAQTGKVRDGRFYYEQDEMRIVKEMMQGKHVLYDIGANIGYYSYVAMAQGVWHAVAFEPVAEMTKIIKEAKKRQNLNIWVVDQPVGFKDQDVIAENGTAYADKQAVTVDWFGLYTGQYPDIMKIDVEGYEADVLAGAVNTLNQFKPDLILSVHPPYLKKLGHDADHMLAKLREFGYVDFAKPYGDTYFLRYKKADEKQGTEKQV